MPLKTHKKTYSKKHPQHFAKVYWPYIPLVLLVLAGLWLGHPVAERSQAGVLSYATDVTSQGLFDGTNSARKTNGGAYLLQNTKLTAAAQAKAQDMVDRNYWSHKTPDGNEPWVFIQKAGYSYQKAGENLAYGFTANGDVITGWMNSPEHRQNMLDKTYQEVGFGVATGPNYQDSGPETIVVAFYAVGGGVTPVVSTGGSGKAFSTTNPSASEASRTISKAQSLTGGKTPWITFAIGLAGGITLAYVAIKHSVMLHRKLRKGEKYFLKHPIHDITAVAFIALCAILSQTSGLIR